MSFLEVEHVKGRLLRYKDAELPLVAIAESTEVQIRKVLETDCPSAIWMGIITPIEAGALCRRSPRLQSNIKLNLYGILKGFMNGLYPGVSMVGSWI